jgi:hypothetical protein
MPDSPVRPTIRDPGVSLAPNTVVRNVISASVSTLINQGSTRE